MSVDRTIWTLEDTEFPDLLPMQNRSPGIHVSDVIDVWQGYEQDGAVDNEVLGRMQLGCALEDAIVHRTLMHYGLDPGYELEMDNLFGTFDALSYIDTGVAQIAEIKLTSKIESPLPIDYPNQREDFNFALDDKFAAWQMQLKAYCYMYGTNYGQLINVHVRRDLTAHWRRRTVVFSDADLATNWAVIRNTAEFMRQQSEE